MMNDTGTLLLLVVLIILSAFFSAAETAFSSCNRIRLKNLANRNNSKAVLVLKLLDNYDKLLTTILVGNNFVNIASASIAASLFVKWFAASGTALSTIVTTIVILIFGEVTPKALAKRLADQMCLNFSSIIYFLVIIFTPLTYAFGAIKKLLDRLTKNASSNDTYTNDELITMVDEVEKEGTLEADESELVRSAIEFNDLDVRDILTPRIDVIAINKNSSIDQIKKTFENNPFSRLPVYEKDIDHIIGFIHEKDFFISIDNNNFNIDAILQKLIVVPQSYSMIDALKLLQKSKAHLAIVVDEYGGTQGIVTMEDILEELVGEIWDEHDHVEHEIIEIKPNTWILEGTCSLVEMFDAIPNHEDDADKFDSDTVGGFISEILERLPHKNEILYYRDLKITVLEVNDWAVKKVEVVKLNQDAENNED